MTLQLIARCVRGLEWVLADEIAALPGCRDLRVAEREVSFSFRAADGTGDRRRDTAGAALLGLRTADDLLLDLGGVGGVDHTRAGLAALPGRIGHLDFRGALGDLRGLRELPERPRFDIVASLLGRRNYNRYAVEDAAGPVIAGLIGGRYISRDPSRNLSHSADAGAGRPGGPGPDASSAARPTADGDLTVRLFLHGPEVRAALRVAARPLHRRPWKLATGPGTLHPPLAAALARIGAGDGVGAGGGGGGGGEVGPSGEVGSDSADGISAGGVAIDPCCGDGTLPIELALARPDLRVSAGDLDPQRLANAVQNAARAGAAGGGIGVGDRDGIGVGFVRADAGRPVWRAGGADLVLTNPPWNRAVGAAGSLARSFDPLWDALPALLAPGGRICTIAELELDIESRLRERGYDIALAQAVRLAGRVSQILLATPPGAAPVRLGPGLAAQRERALGAGLISETGF
jgi:tRNA (guanine6-N2)-methyltransferase